MKNGYKINPTNFKILIKITYKMYFYLSSKYDILIHKRIFITGPREKLIK